MHIKGKSGWTFVTSGGGGGGVAMFAAEKGHVVLKPPQGSDLVFQYAAAGAGASLGSPVNFSGSTEDNFSTGTIFVLEACKGKELTPSDLEGFCLIWEVSAGVMHGGAVTALFLGMPWEGVPKEILKKAVFLELDRYTLLGPIGPVVRTAVSLFKKSPASAFTDLAKSAKALLIMGGVNKGAQIVAGVSGLYGYVWSGTKSSPLAFDIPPEIEETSFQFVTARNDETVMRIPGDILFDYNKDVVKRQADPYLRFVGQYLRAVSPRHVYIEGHTDGIGSHEFNQHLSERRAEAVKRWFVHHQVPLRNPRAIGFGKDTPVAPNAKPNGQDDPLGRAKNRRVEIRTYDY